MITTVNPSQIVLPILALTQTGEANGAITSGTVRVFQIVSGSESNVLAATPLVHIAGSRWAYTWTPASLPAGQYLVEYVLTDGAANYLSQDDLMVLDILTAKTYLSDQELDADNNQIVLVDPDDHATEIARFNTFDSDDEPTVRNVVRRVRV